MDETAFIEKKWFATNNVVELIPLQKTGRLVKSSNYAKKWWVMHLGGHGQWDPWIPGTRSLAQGDPWDKIPGTKGSLAWPLTPGALKCFTKAALAAPALCLWGKKEKEKEERGKEPEVNSAGPTARSSRGFCCSS